MKSKREWIKKNGPWLVLSALLPMMIMAIAYLVNGIYLGSQRTLLASDALSQYANFHASFNNVLHGKQTIFYSWYASLGLNYWSFSAYYLNGVFTPIVFFFDNQSMPDALYSITLLKFGGIGVSFWVFAKQTFKLSNWFYLSFSTAYALMAYTTAYSEVIMWLDAFIYLPLIILGIQRVVDKKKPTLLFFSYLVLFLSNFYMAFIIGVFSFLYFFVVLYVTKKFNKRNIMLYFATSLLAGAASMITILPTLLDLKNNGESLSDFNQFWQPDTGVWDLIVKSMAGVYDTSKYESAPFIYIGLLPLVLCLFYFSDKKNPLRNKVAFGGLFFFLIASIYISFFNLLWHGLHAPNMFLYRFSFLISFLVLLLAGYSLENLRKKDIDKLINVFLILLCLFLAVHFFADKHRYNYIAPATFIINVLFLITYLVGFIFYQKGKLVQLLPLLAAIVMIGETGFNAQAMVAGIKNDWNYPSRALYEENYQDIATLVEQTRSTKENFYRLENLDPITKNDSLNYGYSGITLFSSIRNRHSSAYLNNLGYRSLGSNLNITYANNTLIMDSLLGIKYNLSEQSPMKYGYEKVAESGNYSLYENANALPLGMLTDAYIYEEKAVNNQTELLEHLSGVTNPLFSFGVIKTERLENLSLESNDEVLTYQKKDITKDASITWLIEVPANTQAYLSIVAPVQSVMNKTEAIVTVNGQSQRSNIIETGQYYNLGYYQESQTLTVTTTFVSSEAKIKIYQPDAAFLNSSNFKTAIDKVKEKAVNFEVSGRKASAQVTVNEDQVILTTIPYDKGWHAYVDGKKVKITAFKKAFLTVPISKGTHTIEFIFLPEGFTLGLILFVASFLLFTVLLLWLRQQKKREEGVSNE